MKVCVVHTRYQQPGGEDAAMDADVQLLEANGHTVVRYERHNDEINDLGVGRARVAAETVWSVSAVRALGQLLDRERPDVVHVHNTFPLLSPAVYRAATRHRIPVVQTVQNYRMVCAAYSLLRDAHVCLDCVGRRLPTPAVRYRCYHDSAAQSAVVGAMQVVHRAAGTWARHCDLFLPCSQHVADRLIGAGAIPAARCLVRYNHVAVDPGRRPPGSDQGYVAFVGRLSREKGVDVLIKAAARASEVKVLIAGDGPERTALEDVGREEGATNVIFTGRLSGEALDEVFRGARCLAFPSIWEEPMGLVIAEAGARGVATIAASVGGVPEVVGDAGVLVPPGDVDELAAALRSAAADAAGWDRRGELARVRYEERFSAGPAYAALLDAYSRVGVRS